MEEHILEKITKNLKDSDKISLVWTDPSDLIALIYRIYGLPAEKKQMTTPVTVHLSDGEREYPVLSIKTTIESHEGVGNVLHLKNFFYEEKDPYGQKQEVQKILGGLGFGDLLLNILEGMAINEGEKSKIKMILAMPTKSAEEHGLYTKRGYRPSKLKENPISLEEFHKAKKDPAFLEMHFDDLNVSQSLDLTEKRREEMLKDGSLNLKKLSIPAKFGNLYLKHPSKEELTYYKIPIQHPYTPEFKRRVDKMRRYVIKRGLGL